MLRLKLEKIKKILLIICIFNIFLINNAVYGGENVLNENYNIVWNASDISVGAFNQFNGLSAVGDGVSVTNSSRTYENITYTRTIKTNGYASINNSYVPTKRALKFTTTKPCYITIRAYGTSSDTNVQPMYISRNGAVVKEINLTHNKLSENTVFLSNADTYYIYCLTGSVGICFINIHKVQGDLNLDTIINKDDMIILRQIIYSAEGFSNDIIDNADINSDGNINETDIALLSQLISNSGNSVPMFYNEKVWNIDNYYLEKAIEYTEPAYIDGLRIIPSSVNSTNHVYMGKTGEKYYNNNTYSSFIKTSGKTTYKTDNTIKERGISFFTSGPCCATFLVRVSNEKANNNITITGKNELVAQCDLLDSDEQTSSSLQAVTVYLNKPDEYFLGNTVGGIYLYCIKLTPLSSKNVPKCTLNLELNQEIDLVLDGNNLNNKTYNYILKYDEAKLKLEKISTQSRTGNVEVDGIEVSNNVTNIIKLYDGGYVFSIENTNNNWSGAIAILRFKAMESGVSTIEYSY